MTAGIDYQRKNTGVLSIERDVRSITLEEFTRVFARFAEDAAAAGAARVEVRVAPNGGFVVSYQGDGNPVRRPPMKVVGGSMGAQT